MDLIERMHQGLSKRYPEAHFDAGDGWIRYRPSSDSGFEVGFCISGSDYIINFDSWHDHFEDEESALDWFVFGLSNDCRLKIVSKGGRPFRWIVESHHQGDWQFEREMVVLPLLFWRRASTAYRQNHLRVQRS
ncbi:MAG: hypothetical protein OEU92_06350 [Alphaproteobacteria bacterium]|nr:hypothetical protein [Alphaproteobacteria bacterium]